MHVDGACLDVGCRLPHGFQQMSTRLIATAPLGEGQEQLVLGGRELDVMPVNRYAMSASIDADWTDDQMIR
jgi:hypothetical protein